MTILETIVFEIQFNYMLMKNWIRRKMGIKTKLDELMEKPMKARQFEYKMFSKMSVEERDEHERKNKEIEDMLKDI
jgi:hypothetical protein